MLKNWAMNTYSTDVSSTNPVLDDAALADIRDLLGPDRAIELLRRLHGQLQAELTNFEATAEALSRLRKEAHKLTSAAGTLGFVALSEACRELENAIASGEGTASAFARARHEKANAKARLETLIAA
jgi:HPt (histidine-containing phosphotransfer) domain-containing protein